jgi:hypothetical protein
MLGRPYDVSGCRSHCSWMQLDHHSHFAYNGLDHHSNHYPVRWL